MTARQRPLPRAGDVVHVTRAASVQFVRPILFRVIRVLDWVTYDGWAWVEGYELDPKGNAVSRRSIFVQPAGLRLVQEAQTATPAPRRPVQRRAPISVG